MPRPPARRHRGPCEGARRQPAGNGPAPLDRKHRADCPRAAGQDTCRAEATPPSQAAGALAHYVAFESDDLIDHVVKSTEDQPGALPLLADLFTDLWERMRNRGALR